MKYRSLVVATEPAVEPVTLAEAKLHLRVDTSDDDTYIEALIVAARQWVEEYVDRALVSQQLTLRMDTFPAEFELPRPPMASSGTLTATTITYSLDPGSSGTATPTTTTLDVASYRVDREDTPGKIRTVYGGTWPSHLSDPNAVTVTWWAGYGASGSDVPSAVRHACLMLIGHLYERRLAADSVAANEVPFGVKALLDSQKWGSYR
jgi:uncharacterized phiE125 gp8 family phage protein